MKEAIGIAEAEGIDPSHTSEQSERIAMVREAAMRFKVMVRDIADQDGAKAGMPLPHMLQQSLDRLAETEFWIVRYLLGNTTPG